VTLTRAGLSRRWLAFRNEIPSRRLVGAELSSTFTGARLTIRQRGAADVVLRGARGALEPLQLALLAAIEKTDDLSTSMARNSGVAP
jgi:hypothetical protein